MNDAAVVFGGGFSAGLTPDPDYTVSDWADTHRMLSQKASAEPGKFRTDRTPYLRDIQDDLSPMSPVKTVIFMAGAQVGKTESGNNWIGFVMHHAPGPMMMVQPTVDTAKRVSKQRIAPMIEETPVLRKIITENKSRDSSSTMMMKEFEGGVLIMTGANSAVGLRSMPIRYLFMDEVDGYPLDVDGEGDPVSLAERRTTTFARRKIYKCSTPTDAATSRINKDYLASDQRKYFVACPHCGERQWLKWGGPNKPFGIKWPAGEPEKAYYVCEHNGCIITEDRKTEMLLGGEWRATAVCADPTVHGYHLSSLYSPVGWKSWGEVASEFLRVKSDPMLLKTWINTVLGEVWEDEFAAKIGADSLMARRESYPLLFCPTGTLMLTAGIDTQDSRLEVSVYGWGRGEESWLINHTVIQGDPQRPEIWAQLDDLLAMKFTHESGGSLQILAACIDSGGSHTQAVYDYARRRKPQLIPIKGMSEPNKPIIGKPTKQDVNHKGVALKGGVELWPVGPDTAKSTIYGRLKLTEHGPGYVHFPDAMGEDYFQQLTAETQIIEYVHGFPKRKWIKSAGQRNEALDCAVYALAALKYFMTRYNPATLWKQLESRLFPEGVVTEVVVKNEEPAPVQEPDPDTPPVLPSRADTIRPPAYQIKRPGRSWASGWRGGR